MPGSARNSQDIHTQVADTSLNVPIVSESPPDLNLVPYDVGKPEATWEVPIFGGGSEISEYTVHSKTTNGDWDVAADVTKAVVSGQEYTVRVVVVNDVGAGPPSLAASRTPR